MGLFDSITDSIAGLTRIWVNPYANVDVPVTSVYNEHGDHALVVLDVPRQFRGTQLWFAGRIGKPGYQNWIDGKTVGGPLPETDRRRQALVLAVARSGVVIQLLLGPAVERARSLKHVMQEGSW